MGLLQVRQDKPVPMLSGLWKSLAAGLYFIWEIKMLLPNVSVTLQSPEAPNDVKCTFEQELLLYCQKRLDINSHRFILVHKMVGGGGGEYVHCNNF